ncbi:MAG TPA: hypothetical protein VHG28_17550 [Longimicrobiaceae bacterium]|nr:hypothetical protein [Longimicrobiaceae bacterium]
MSDADVAFFDDRGREWAVRIQWGHPTPAELGIVAVRFECVSAPDEPARVGFALRDVVESGDTEGLREALSESDPAHVIG